MDQFLWLALAWIAGTALILGSLMTLGSLLLWFVPTTQLSKKADDRASLEAAKPWQGRLKLLAFSLAIALTGLSLLIVVPFPA